jgi:DHA2 family multidrug resistance protein
MTRFDPQIDFRTAAMARVLQGLGLSCLFVPINTAAYAFLPKEKNNAASGLINLGRNIGGSLGISLVATMLARRTQVHQQNLTANLNGGNSWFESTFNSLVHNFVAHGASAAQATHQAYAVIGNMINQQATMLAYIDDFWIVGWAVLVMIPLVFLMKRVKPGAPMAAH